LGTDLLTTVGSCRQSTQTGTGTPMNERNNALDPHRNGAVPVKAESEPCLHPAWIAFVRYCQQMGHGEIARLKIQDGIPVLVEVSRQKIKFS
jgi:hypothetical protein